MYWTLGRKALTFVRELETRTVIARINMSYSKTLPKVVVTGENEEKTASSLKF